MEKEKVITVMKRYELKYKLNSEQVQFFMDQISRYMKVDKYGLTSIATIYFDTPDYRLINKSIEKPKQIMDRFYRSPSTKKEGSGVGLSIAKEIINLHHGTIKIDKNPTSLTFIITF